MTSFILSFNKLLIVITVVVLIGIEISVSFIYPEFNGIDYHIREDLAKATPDIILLGTSPLEYALSTAMLTNELRGSLHEKVRVYMYTPWRVKNGADLLWYLILRNQMGAPDFKAPPVGIALLSSTLIDRKLSANGKILVKRQFKYENELPFIKHQSLADRVSQFNLLEYSAAYRAAVLISKDLRTFFVDTLLALMRAPAPTRAILGRNFAGREFNWQAGKQKFIKAKKYDFDRVLQASYLPEIVALVKQKKMDLFIVNMPNRPLKESGIAYDPYKLFDDELKEYLEGNGIKFISFSNRPEFQQDDFMDELHLKDKKVFSKLLAQELVARGILKPHLSGKE